MSLRKILMSRRAVPEWIQSIAIIGVGLYFSWEAIRPGGPQMFRTNHQGAVVQASAELTAEATDYIERTKALNRALADGDQELADQIMAEQKILNNQMEQRLVVMRATEAEARTKAATIVRPIQVIVGILGALIISLGVWNLISRRNNSIQEERPS